jgi:alanyl-tRNA synthetase
MKIMTTRELKEKYFEFFKQNGHKAIPSASLIPENDPTALFISAGMHPLVPYLLGEKHPCGDKLVSVQKCIRTGDIDEVGDDVHLTFFEMLGNWGLGSYWKKEAIEMSWEFLIDKKWLGLDKKKISVSCFEGDPSTRSARSGQVPRDEESAEVWKSLGVKEIKFFGRDQNWWGPAGKTGPCGPDTEMFFEGIEIWNDVFMEYNKTADGKYEPLKQKNVDTGMGVERTVAILSGKKSVYDIEPLKSIVKKVQELAKTKDMKAERIITDHLRAATFIMGDEKGIAPSNVEQGYVLRRLIRRAIRYSKKIGIEKSFTHEIGKLVIDLMGDDYPELIKNKDFVIEQFNQEEEKFGKTLEKGLKEFEKGTDPFILFTTYGFPIEMTEELAKEKGIKIDKEKFQKDFEQHQELSRTATAGKFKSGLADNSEQVTKLHTATHLLLAALRKVLGEHVYQKGSNITAERLRLDFSHKEKMTAEQIKKVEDAVNEVILRDLPVNCNEMSLEKAKEIGAMGVFESKYGDKVKVYSVGTPDCPYSCEICAGPHITHTGQLGHFKILKEEASSAGVRRIKAIVE